MEKYYSPFSLRVSEILMEKLKKIAHENKRSTNKEIEYALDLYVKNYEQQNGEIKVDI